MTYCVGIKLDAGLVFASDSRTNAGLDHISTFRKMMVYERPGDRFMVLLSAGNLSISQSVRELLQTAQIPDEPEPLTIWNVQSMFDAARVLGVAMRTVADRDGPALEQAGLGESVGRIYREHRVAGFNTYGEQHGGLHVNQTFVGLAFLEPDSLRAQAD